MKEKRMENTAFEDIERVLAVIFFWSPSFSLYDKGKKKSAGAEGKKKHCRMMEKSAERHLLSTPIMLWNMYSLQLYNLLHTCMDSFLFYSCG